MKRPNKGAIAFKELEAAWYKRLEASGFDDIEDTANPDRPLKEWHSRKFNSERARIRQAERERYDQKLSAFLNSPDVGEICRLIAAHGNNSIGPQKAKRILEFHRDGLAERAIAKKVKCSRECVHRTLTKAKQWMKLAA